MNKFKYLLWLLPILALVVLGVVYNQTQNALFDVSASQCDSNVGQCTQGKYIIKSISYNSDTRTCNFNLALDSKCGSVPNVPTTNYGNQGTTTTTTTTNTQTTSCEAKYIGQKYCTGNTIYQMFQDSGCGTTEKTIESCSDKCVNGICEVTQEEVVDTQVVDVQQEGLDMQTFGIIIAVVIVVGAIGFVYYNKSKKKRR